MLLLMQMRMGRRAAFALFLVWAMAAATQALSGQAPSGQPAETPEEKAARLEAINRLRTNEAGRSGTEVAPAFPAQSQPSSQAKGDAGDRARDAGDSGNPGPTIIPARDNGAPPSQPGQPSPSDPEAEDGLGDGSQPPAGAEPPRERPKRRPPSRPHGGLPPADLPPVPGTGQEPTPEESESILEETDVGSAGGDLAYQNPLLDSLTLEFNAAARECDIAAFLAAREKLLAELRRILSNPHLEERLRDHFEELLKGVEQTRIPIRLDCPRF